MKTQSPSLPASYGIHTMKAAAIVMQIIAHTAIWCVQYGMYPLQKIGGGWDYVAPIVISLSPMLPMTAGAVLRLLLQTSPDGRRLVNIAWATMLGSLAFLMLVESVKQALVYNSAFFFSWNALHLIAISSLMILIVGRYSIKALWVIALAILFYTPVVTGWLDVIEAGRGLDNSPFSWPLKGVLLAGIFSLFMAAMFIIIFRSRALATRYRIRSMILLGGLWLLGGWLLLLTYSQPMDRAVLETAWIGILAGTRNGFHTWGIFPWAGLVILGFLLYDLIVRYRAHRLLLLAMLAIGLAITVYIGGFYGDSFYQTFSRGSLVSSTYFNRFYLLPLLIIGLFCAAAPLAYWAARAGWETPYIIDLSRSILWVYVYQTSILIFAAQWAVKHLPAAYNSDIYAPFAIISAMLLPLAIKLLPTRLKFSLKKSS